MMKVDIGFVVKLMLMLYIDIGFSRKPMSMLMMHILICCTSLYITSTIHRKPMLMYNFNIDYLQITDVNFCTLTQVMYRQPMLTYVH